MKIIRNVLVLLLCLPLVACFEEPVAERLHLTLRSWGPVIVTVVQEVADPDLAKNNAELESRLEESRGTLESDLDPWSRRFALQQPLAEHKSAEWIEGSLRRSIHSAVLGSFEDVVQMVEADGLTGTFARADGIAELNLFPTGGSRATYAQRQEVDRRLEEWSESLAQYFETTIDLYSYLDLRPERAVPCLAHIFDTQEAVEAAGPLEAAEEELIGRVKDSLDFVVDVLLVPDGESFSTNELTRLVFDPFPARLTITVDGQVIESKGFIAEPRFFE